MKKLAAPSGRHKMIIRKLPIDGQWRTFTQLWETLPAVRPSWKRFRHALRRGRDHGFIEHMPPTEEMRQKWSQHRGYWRVVKHPPSLEAAP